MTLTQTLRGMAQYLSATADPIDRERWAMTLRDTADALATAQAERYALLRSVDMEVTARRNADAALTEARRVLGEVDKRVIQCSMCYAMIGGYRPEPHTPDCAIAAVLAQEEEA